MVDDSWTSQASRARALGEWCMVKKFVQNLEFTEILRIFAPEKEIHV